MKVILFIGLIDFVLSSISYIYYYKNLSAAKARFFTITYFLLALNAVLSRMLPDNTPAFLLKISSWLGGLWIAFLYYSLWLIIIHALLWLICKILKIKLPSAKTVVCGLAAIICFIAYGTYQAFNPVVRTETINTSKLPDNENIRIVLVSDIHLGRILGYDYAKQLVELVNQQHPDYILLAGDIADERLQYITQENSLAPLKNFKSVHGVYAAFGNHDYLDNPEMWRSMLEKHNITVLQDENVQKGDVSITGLNDYSKSKTAEPLKNLISDRNKYNIVIDHQPRKISAASQYGYDLYVSGHTHTGQLFPNKFITERMYPLDYGIKKFDNLTAVTSSGYGFWGPPVRTEYRPEIVVINLKGTKDK